MKKFCIFFILSGFFFLNFSPTATPERVNFNPNEISMENSRLILRIFSEVKDMESGTGSLVSRQFFVGDDDDDTNKDIHVHVLIQPLKPEEKMTLQVSYFERGGAKSTVYINKETRNIICLIHKDEVKLTHNDYASGDLEPILAGILKAVRDKKKLLSLLKKTS